MAFNRLPLEEKIALKAEWRGACLIWTGTRDVRGYGRIRIGGKWLRAHRVAFELLRGPIPEGMVLMHSCDTPACINIAHLSVGTQGDNIRDCDAKGRRTFLKGSAHHQAKLTEAQVAEIRRRYRRYDHKSGARTLGREFGVSGTVINGIVKREAWRHVP